jgi:hypothetical protein
MNLHAHPYTWAAEMAWREESMQHAGLTAEGLTRSRRTHRRPRWRSLSERLGRTVRTARTARSAGSRADGVARAFCPVIPRDLTNA